MRELLLNKIARNEDRIYFWKWCLNFVTGKEDQYRIRYHDEQFYIESFSKAIGWLRTVHSDPEK